MLFYTHYSTWLHHCCGLVCACIATCDVTTLIDEQWRSVEDKRAQDSTTY